MSSSIDFDTQNAEVAKINYSVPLLGNNSGKCILQLDLGLQPTDFLESVRTTGQTYAEAAGIMCAVHT